MSLGQLRPAAGHPVAGLPYGPVTAPASTWPGPSQSATEPNGRGAALLALEKSYRPLTLRDEEQLEAGRRLAPGLVGPVGASAPLALGVGGRTWRPAQVDRGWRVPYYIPPTPGSGGGANGPEATSYPGGKSDCC